MSDSLASESTLERPSDNGQVERASEQPQSGTGGQTSQGQSAQQKNNVAEIQRIKDKEIDNLRKTFEQERRQNQQLIQNLQREMRAAQLNAAPDDYSKKEIELQHALMERDQYAAAYQQAVAAQQAEAEKMSALREIADEFDVPIKALEGASDYKSAVKLAIKAQQEAERHKQRQDDDKRERNMPDLGGGAPRTSLGKLEDEWNEARKNRNSEEMVRIERLMRGKK